MDVVRQRYGAFADDDLRADLGGDSIDTHELADYEDDPSFAEDA